MRDLVREALDEAREMVRLELALARDELSTEFRRARTAAVRLGIAAGAAVAALAMFLVAIAAAFVPMWVAALVIGAVVLLASAMLGYRGYRALPAKPLAQTVQRTATSVTELRTRIP